VNALADQEERVATIETMSARVLADAQRSFAAQVDSSILREHVSDVMAQLWTESTKVTTFIPVLALRELRVRLNGDSESSPTR
jgi:hypothetical protein